MSSFHPKLKAAWALFIGATLFSCDTYEDPILGVIEPCDATEVPEFEPLNSAVQGILIEDFTAHQCGNCPPAGLILKGLAEEHPGQLIPLAVHAGDLASTNEEYPPDWTTAEGSVYWFDMNANSYPIGRVNRLESELDYYPPDFWSDLVDGLLDASPQAGIQMVVDHEEGSGKTGVHVHITWFEGLAGAVRLGLLISENHLVGPQLWYPNVDPPGPGYIDEFEHEHMLRGSVTGAKGFVVSQDPETGETQQECYAFTMNPEWNASNCDLVAVLTADNGRVIQTLAVPIVE